MSFSMAVYSCSVMVALHPEGVDRNLLPCLNTCLVFEVALHPEGVDRNIYADTDSLHLDVALHPEGVDRNRSCPTCRILNPRVALHPEGVDRNISELYNRTCKTVSPSTRRAWIEI